MNQSLTRWSISFLMSAFCESVALKLVMTPSSLFSSRTIFWPTSLFSLKLDSILVVALPAEVEPPPPPPGPSPVFALINASLIEIFFFFFLY